MQPLDPTPEGDAVSLFNSHAARAVHLADGDAETRDYLLRIDPGGEIGTREAGKGQPLIALAGSGWAAGTDGQRLPITNQQAIRIERGEVHAKGSDTGLVALMIQVRDLH